MDRMNEESLNKIRICVDQLDIYILNSEKNEATHPLVVMIIDGETNKIVSSKVITSHKFGIEDLRLIIERYTPNEISILPSPFVNLNAPHKCKKQKLYKHLLEYDSFQRNSFGLK